MERQANGVKKQHTAFTDRQIMNRPDFEFFHYIDPEPVEVDYHDHDFYEIFFFLSGSVEYVIEGKMYALRPGDILLTNNRDLHRPLVSRGKVYERFVFWVNQSYVDSICKDGDSVTACFEDAAKRHYKLIRPGNEILVFLKRLCVKLEESFDNQAYGHRVLQNAYMMEFLVYLNRAYFDTSNAIQTDVTENAKINLVLEYINLHLSDDLSLDLLAQRFYTSKYYLGNQFKQYTGFTIYQYILKKRLINARLQIRQGVPITDACLNSGFNDYSNFLKAFKREFGTVPRHMA